MQVAKNTWIRRIVVVKRTDKRRIDELRVEVGVRGILKKKLVNSRFKWAGHIERMRDGKLDEIECPEIGGKWRLGRPRIRWEDNERMGGEWRTPAKDRSWELLI